MLILEKNSSIMLGVNFSREGYLQLKKDREILLKQISELQSVLNDFDFAYPFLNSLFEPEFKVRINDKSYFGELEIVIPYLDTPMKLEFEIGSVSNYIGEKDPKLMNDFYSKSEEELKKKFPINFK
jgi:hypothetical protein